MHQRIAYRSVPQVCLFYHGLLPSTSSARSIFTCLLCLHCLFSGPEASELEPLDELLRARARLEQQIAQKMAQKEQAADEIVRRDFVYIFYFFAVCLFLAERVCFANCKKSGQIKIVAL